MKNFYALILFFLLLSCSNNKSVYWCGDHPCINKKEREAYFKKTMIVEIKEIKDLKSKDSSEIEKITKQARLQEKSRLKKEKEFKKQSKLEEKLRLKREKKLEKEAKLREKERLKKEKELKKQSKLKKKIKVDEEEELAKKIELDEKKFPKAKEIKKNNHSMISDAYAKVPIESDNFNNIVQKIIKENSFKPFPDINDIPD
tara:strand:- start:2011 stop:2613 length:603 start_codon:yes stop_codon:yes gene_type:complete